MYAKKRSPWLKILIALLCLALAGAGLWLFDTYVDRSGWVEKNGIYSYRDFHGRKVTGWQEIDGVTYYFGDDKTMATGWLKLDGSTYYLGGDGTLDSGWLSIGESWYHTDENSVIQSGWQDIDGKRYFFAKNGAMHTGWLEEDDGKTYHMGQDGTLTLGFAEIEENTYYFGNTGQLVTGQLTLEEGSYYFDENGIMQTGWLETEAGRAYYLPETGCLASGWQEIDGERLYLRDDGTLYTGWLEEGEYSYYLLPDGSFATGPMEIDGQLHYFSPKGIHVVLVNYQHEVPAYYNVNLVKIDGWHQVSDVCYDALRKMLDDCRAAVGYYEFNSAYRSINDQIAILEARTQENMTNGRTYGAAKAIALQSVAVPGTSEHHLGLAVDILGDSAIEWLTANCWEYGFIVRYQAEKSHITGIIDEPWHYRYVGTEVSMDLKDSGLCLEEYLGAYVPEEEPENTEEAETPSGEGEEAPQEETAPVEEDT